MSQPRPIIIAGAGIAGLSAAIAIARSGRKTLVLERASEPYELGAGLQLSPNAVRVLEQLGLGPALADVSLRPQALTVKSALSGKDLSRMDLANVAEERYGAPYCVLARPALHRLLTEAAQNAGIDIRYDSEVANYSDDPNGITAQIKGGESVFGEALIGADGLWSNIRKTHWPGHSPRPTSMTAWRAIIDGETSARCPINGHQVTAWLAPKLHAVTYTIDADGTLNLVVVIQSRSTSEGWDITGNAQDLRLAAANLFGPLRDAIAQADNWRCWPLFDAPPMPASIPSGPQAVTLIGDAAHPMLPFLAQGAGMAIEDALSLAQALAATPSEPAKALRLYAQARRTRITRVTNTAARNGQIFHLRGVPAVARNLTLKALSANTLLTRYDWLYGGGPASKDNTHQGGPQSGAS